MKWGKKLCVFLIEADIFNEAVQTNIATQPLRNLCTQFDMTTLRYCGEEAGFEKKTYFGKSDGTIIRFKVQG